MYCPRCSQEQVLEDVKFCSRCGLPLAFVADALANDGLPSARLTAPFKKKKLTRRSGSIFALLWFLFFVVLMAPLVGLDNDDDALVMLIFGVAGSFIMIVVSFLLLENAPNQNAETDRLKNLSQKNQAALPPQQSIPAGAYVPSAGANWRDTNDLVQPSVTDNTTKLLSRDE